MFLFKIWYFTGLVYKTMFYESFFYQQLHFFNWRVISLLQFKTINIHHYPYISKSKKRTELHKLIHLLLDKKLMNAFRKYVHDNLKTKCSHTNYYCCYHHIFTQTNKSLAHIFFWTKKIILGTSENKVEIQMPLTFTKFLFFFK